MENVARAVMGGIIPPPPLVAIVAAVRSSWLCDRRGRARSSDTHRLANTTRCREGCEALAASSRTTNCRRRRRRPPWSSRLEPARPPTPVVGSPDRQSCRGGGGGFVRLTATARLTIVTQPRRWRRRRNVSPRCPCRDMVPSPSRAPRRSNGLRRRGARARRQDGRIPATGDRSIDCLRRHLDAARRLSARCPPPPAQVGILSTSGISS